ncbi:NUDIX hydrolase [Paenibacillus yanchengensis]|uniref:NUDIX hydrolase n=1 Tax=Paenibacillus yanchengensis TaxID=2035833 RepID=A0ABW4YQ73_9BACL
MEQNNTIFQRHMGVYGISISDRCLLVIKKILGPYTGKYDLPGGRLEGGESLEKATIREVHEETGYSVEKMEHIGVCDFFINWVMQDNTIEHVHHIAILYEVKIDSEEPSHMIEKFEGQDSGGAIWIPLHELTPKNSSPLVLQAIEWINTRTLQLRAATFDYSLLD